MIDARKQKLITALQAERDRFVANGCSTEDHDVTIEYLKTGTTTYDWEDYDLLDGAIHDLEGLYSDYGCNPSQDYIATT